MTVATITDVWLCMSVWVNGHMDYGMLFVQYVCGCVCVCGGGAFIYLYICVCLYI